MATGCRLPGPTGICALPRGPSRGSLRYPERRLAAASCPRLAGGCQGRQRRDAPGGLHAPFSWAKWLVQGSGRIGGRLRNGAGRSCGQRAPGRPCPLCPALGCSLLLLNAAGRGCRSPAPQPSAAGLGRSQWGAAGPRAAPRLPQNRGQLPARGCAWGASRQGRGALKRPKAGPGPGCPRLGPPRGDAGHRLPNAPSCIAAIGSPMDQSGCGGFGRTAAWLHRLDCSRPPPCAPSTPAVSIPSPWGISI